MQGIDECGVNLQQRFTTSQNDVAVLLTCRPQSDDLGYQGLGSGVFATQRAVGTHKVGIAKTTDGIGAIDLTPAPEITTSEAAKHRWPTCTQALALQGVKNFLNAVTHGTTNHRRGCGSEVLDMVFLYMTPVWMLSSRRGCGIEGQDCTVGAQSRIIVAMPQIILTPAQRKVHRSDAHHLDPVVMIGGDGLTDAVKKEVDAALKAHGLIKVRVFSDDRAQREVFLATLADELHAAPIQHIGKLLVLWRPMPEKEKTVDEDRMPGPRDIKVLKYSKKGGQRPEVKQVRVLGNERLTFGGLIKRAKKSGPRSSKKGAQK